MSEQVISKIETWAIVEIMGHQRLAGYVTTEPFGSVVMLRVDIPRLEEKEFDRYGTKYKAPAEPAQTQYIGMGSIYRLTPCTEELARQAVDRERKMAPVRLELPSDYEPPRLVHRDEDELDYEDQEDE